MEIDVAASTGSSGSGSGSEDDGPPTRGGRRGRARSGAFHTGDIILADLDAVLGESTPPTPTGSASSDSLSSLGAGSTGSGSGGGSSGEESDDDSKSDGSGPVAGAGRATPDPAGPGATGSGSGASSGTATATGAAAGAAATGAAAATAAAGGAAAPKRRPVGIVSKKTAKILTTLEPHPRSSAAPEPTAESAEELEERILAEAEARRQAELKRLEQTEAGKRKKGPKRRVKEQEYDLCIKLLLLGDAGVGKTSLMLRYADHKFSTGLLSTAGVDYKTKYLNVAGKTVKCQIWDTAGQQRFHIITQTYYRGAHGIILVYDVSDPTEESFANVRYWMNNIQTHASPTTQKILLGNKIDVPGKKIETARGQQMADEYGISFLETSAKNDTNVTKAFHSIASDIIQRQAYGPGSGAGTARLPDKVKVVDVKPDKKGRCSVM